jgi:hypothetical protein
VSITRVAVPEGERGPWRVERFEVTEDGARFHNFRCDFSPGGYRRRIVPGTYTRLMRGRTVVMSDTPAEQQDHSWFVRNVKGRALLHGLGLGMVLAAVLKKPEVTDVTVVEIDADVIALVGPHYEQMARDEGKPLAIIHGDALKWQPPKGARWGAVWHDIWDSISADNLPDMKTLHRRFGRRADWQGSWARELLR